jgi:hypothetical protein
MNLPQKQERDWQQPYPAPIAFAPPMLALLAV